MNRRLSRTVILLTSAGLTFLFFNIFGCLPDPYGVGQPDSLFSEYVLIWELMDSHYACFFARENVDWDEVYRTYKPSAEDLGSRDELTDLCLEMLGELEDPNVILRDSAGNRLNSCDPDFFYNWDLGVWSSYMTDWGWTGDLEIYDAFCFDQSLESIGYIYINSLGEDFNIASFFEVTLVVQECSGLILDLRMCSESGDDINAHYACGRFIDELALGYYRSIRVGPGRNDMGEMQEVFAYRNGAWQFTGPIVLLTGRYDIGASEQLVLFLRSQNHVTVIGDTTAGFGNPAVSFNLTEGWTIEIPEMVTYSPDTTLIFNSGIAPDILIPVNEADFAAGVDPVLDAALKMLTQ